MELSTVAAIIMTAAVELSGLPLEPNMEPQYEVMTQQELVADLCVEGKEHQCKGYKTFSPPMSNKIIISTDLHPETNVYDQGIMFHEAMKYLLFVNTKVSPIDSCEKVWAMESRIYKLQMRFLVMQMARGEAGSSSNDATGILEGDKGTFITWCDPTKQEKPNPPKYIPKSQIPNNQQPYIRREGDIDI